MTERSEVVARLRQTASLLELGGGDEFVRHAVELARRGGVRRDEVLNARSFAAFQEAVRPVHEAHRTEAGTCS